MRNTVVRFLGVAAIVATSVSCGDVVRQTDAPVFLVVESLQAKTGNGGALSSFLQSDVQNLVTTPAPCTDTNPCPTIFNDVGSATMHLAPKDVTNPNAPTSNNAVTITRVHINYRRADGRNTPGVDVPYPWDAAVSVTVPPTGQATVGFEIVRHVAKEEAPLVQLRTNPSVINTITEVTFFGHDQTGNQISVMGTIQINFGNFAG
jgi:hypothetical protein